MSSIAQNNVILLYDKKMLQSVDGLGRERLRILRNVLVQLGYPIVKEYAWDPTNVSKFTEGLLAVEARFVISLVDAGHDPILRHVDFDHTMTSHGISDPILLFFRNLYRIGDVDSPSRRVLILLMNPGDSTDRLVSTTVTTDNFCRLAMNEWVTDFSSSESLELDFNVVIQLVFEPWRQQENTSLTCGDILRELGIEENVFVTKFPQGISELLKDEIGLEKPVQEAFFSILTGFFSTSYRAVTKLLIAINLLNSMRMARRLGSFTLEGEKFNCWVIMAGSTVDKTKTLESKGFALIFKFYDWISFDVHHEKAVRDVVELSLGDSVFLLVELSTNRIDSVWGGSKSQASFNDLKSHIKGIAVFGLHVREDERVELLDKEFVPKLIWDGFKWKQSEIVLLKKVLEGQEHDNLKLSQNVIKVIIDSVDELLMGGYSSIFFIVHETDKCNWNKISDKSLRADLLPPRGSFAPKQIDQMNAIQLATVLKLDGAHLLDCNGKLYQVCRNLSFQPGAWNVWKPDLADETTSPGKVVDFPKQFIDRDDSSWRVKLNPGDSAVMRKFIDYMRGPLSGRPFDQKLLQHLNLVRASTDTFTGAEKIAQGSFDLSAENDSFTCDFTKQSNFSLFVRVSYPQAIAAGLSHRGLFASVDHRFFYVDVLQIKDVQEYLDSSDSDIAPLLSQSLDHWFRTGCVSGSGSSGTGSRAALEASKVLSNSLVVKISASGKLLIFKGGKPISNLPGNLPYF